MAGTVKKQKYDLEERTKGFAIDVRRFLKRLPVSISNKEDARQLVKSSGSIGANYIEANESLSKKDFKHRVKISRKEAKESVYWLAIIIENNHNLLKEEGDRLKNEAEELKKILSSILERSN